MIGREMEQFLLARFDNHLRQAGQDRGGLAFRVAFQLYALQRGTRAAQRAVREKQSLTLETYRCGEDAAFLPDAGLLREFGAAEETVEYLLRDGPRLIVQGFHVDIPDASGVKRVERQVPEAECVRLAANVFATFRKMAGSMLGAAGVAAAERVKADAIARFGKAEWETVEAHLEDNFNICTAN